MPLLRALYRPFFPPTSSPSSSPPPQPSLSPTQPPSLSPFPKYPSSATNLPFFPIYPSPPPPPAPSLPTYPANISSLTIPQSSRNGPHHPNSSKLLTSIFLPILALLLITSLSIFYLHLRRRRRSFGDADDSRSDSHRLFPPNSAPSDGQKLQTSSRPTSSEFLYLGTLVNSRADTASAAAAVVPPSTGESPELRPLPPLSRQVKQGFGNADVGCSSEEEFYSPKASPGSRRTSQVVAKLENVSSKSSTSSSDLCLSSSLPVSSSPSASTVEPVSSSKVADGDIGQDLDERSKLSGFSGGNLQSPTSIGEFSRNPFAFRPPEKQPPAPPFLMPPRYRAVESNRRIKVKPLHWNNVPAISDRATAWDWMKSSSFQVNDGTIEALFACNGVDTALKRRQEEEEKMVIDPKKSQNIGILIEALNVSTEDVCEALLEGNVDILSIELLETLRRMAPRKEEELKLKERDDASLCRLGPAEKFLKAMLEVPFAFKRVDALLYVAKFQSEVDYLMQSFETLEAASEELRNSQLFLRILDAVLKAGNHINMGTNQGIAHGFKLDTLLKLVYIKATDGKTTLLDYILQEIIKMEGSRLLTPKNHVNASQGDQEYKMLGLQVVSRLSDELIDVKKAAGMDVDVLSSCSSQLAAGIEKVREVVRLNMLDVATRNGQLFHEAMQGFLKRAEGEIVNVQAREGIAVSLVRELTEYFHGDSANEEGHPLKIFMVIRDFLFVLDQVCKEVSRVNDRGFFSMQMPFPGGREHEFIVDVSHHSCIKARSF